MEGGGMSYERAPHPGAHAVRRGGGDSKHCRLSLGSVRTRALVDASRAEVERREHEAEAERRAFLELLARRLATTARLPIETCRRRVAGCAVTAQPVPEVEVPLLRRFG
jgi:hypothetical protein